MLRSALLLLVLHACLAQAAARPSEPPSCAPTALDCRWACIPGRSDPGCYTVASLARPAAPETGITLVTQATRSKLHYLEPALASWGGPASIAFYAYDAAELAFFSAYRCAGCTVSVVHSGGAREAYPINLLRNVALSAAPTALVFLFDTDFLPSPQLHDLLVGHVARARETSRTAFVVPAFEFRKNASVPRSFPQLRDLYFSRAVRIFHGLSGGHQYTQVDTWLQSKVPYCLQCTGASFEPYVVVNKTEPGFPLFDEQYVDRGMNKVVWVRELKRRHYSFCVVPYAWVLHAYERRPRYLPHRSKRGDGTGLRLSANASNPGAVVAPQAERPQRARRAV